jgi:[acyl-carrier-protein] S-malonyltransferase
VRWTASIQYLLPHGITTFFELGSGSVLSGLLKRINPTAVGIALGNPEDFAKLDRV